MFKEELAKAAAEYGISLNDTQMAQYNRYFELLVEWNEKINLTAITEPKEVAIKHMIDSITAYDEKLFKDGTTVIDVGTGAGFPGLPLKIFCPEIKLTLMDSLNKRIKFLQTVVEELGLKDVECVHARAEEGARNKKYRESFDIAVSRAVARLPILCEYCLPFVKKGGHFIALKGMQYQDEAAEAVKAIKVMGGSQTEIRPVKLPELDDKRAVIIITKTMPTPKTYPRKAGTPTKNPIV
ncbi:MAG: 16S rRNA (guanine(527)-N(7))-methyltransferase RsmG [Selenomonas ruminantium]|jgi:16S rRNA (guanine527-N7)-methyltransferase|uniref:Ribosomal RNA small subunit methyltransferase G n=1 Tax=Selenomonas ruminantium TaxID=971 RepID=A0A927WQH6_SELRU|nr:16S rRNA (guanine(527)-N(7))-methyltransferase RsmG [Selenomonas ruminantium]MBE6085779.1 16S rRNA (guanine(527)-N(7))-methyltransferase RsmG [Selenomonas ruminantium]